MRGIRMAEIAVGKGNWANASARSKARKETGERRAALAALNEYVMCCHPRASVGVLRPFGTKVINLGKRHF